MRGMAPKKVKHRQGGESSSQRASQLGYDPHHFSVQRHVHGLLLSFLRRNWLERERVETGART